MAWDRTKWNEFVTGNTVIPKTDEAVQEAIANAQIAAETFTEDIDLNALGIQRIKDMLRDLAAVSHGPTGPQGVEGPENLQVISAGLDFRQRWAKVAGVAASQTIDFNIPQGLNGDKEILKLVINQFNVLNTDIDWVNSLGTTTIISVTAPFNLVPAEVWIMEAQQPADGFVKTLAMAGLAPTTSLGGGMTSAVTIATPASVPWMAIGGTLRIEVSAIVVDTEYGIHIQMQGGIAP